MGKSPAELLKIEISGSKTKWRIRLKMQLNDFAMFTPGEDGDII